MARILSAHVVLDSGDDFTARIANLTPSSVFIHTLRPLAFRERVTITFFSVSVHGVVAHASLEPPGLVLALEGSPETRVMIEECMNDVPVLWPETRRSFDRNPTLEHMPLPPAITERNQFEDPTNTGSDPVRIEDPEEGEFGELSQPAAVPEDRNSPRLRATTVVGEQTPTDEVFVDEPTEDSYG